MEQRSSFKIFKPMEITKQMYLLAKKIVEQYEQKPKEVKKVKPIEERKQDFIKALRPYVRDYPEGMLNDFYLYWSEHGERDRKFRMEKEKSFNIELRLKTWSKRSKQYGEKSLTLAQQMKKDYGVE